MLENLLYKLLISSKKAFVHSLSPMPLEVRTGAPIFRLFLLPDTPAGRAATMGSNEDIRENGVPNFF